MSGRLTPPRLVGADGRATTAARGALVLAVLIAFGLGFALRPGTEENAVGAAESEAPAERIAGAKPAGAVTRLSGAAALPALDRTPRKRRAARARPAEPTAGAAPAPTPTSTPEPAAAATPAPSAAPAPVAAPPPARPAPARPSPPQSPSGQSFDSSG